jgi:hypothetical protein
MDFALIQDLQGFLATFAPWRFQGFGSGLSGLGLKKQEFMLSSRSLRPGGSTVLST